MKSMNIEVTARQELEDALRDVGPLTRQGAVDELRARLQAAGIDPRKFDLVWVSRELANMQRAGRVETGFDPADVLPGSRLRPGAERLYELIRAPVSTSP
jgi:hypothetical protein